MATEFPRHGIKTLKSEDIMDAWDRVGTVTSEIITSLMNKEAATVLSDLKEKSVCQSSENATRGTSLSVGGTAIPGKLVTSPGRENGSHVTKINALMQAENYHRLLRNEMVEVKRDLNSL